MDYSPRSIRATITVQKINATVNPKASSSFDDKKAKLSDDSIFIDSPHSRIMNKADKQVNCSTCSERLAIGLK